MKYPTLRELQASRDWVNVFGGYNHNLRISDSEFYEMKNMTGDDYPTLSPRRKRGIFKSAQGMGTSEYSEFNSIIAKESLCWVETTNDGTFFYVNGARPEAEKPGVVCELTDGPKQLISMGAYVIVYPDKKYINTENMTMGDIEAKTTINASGNNVIYTPCPLEGSARVYVSTTAPEGENLEKYPYWLDISIMPHTLKVYSTSAEGWSAMSTTYVEIRANRIGTNFEAGDGVTIIGANAVKATTNEDGTTTTPRKDIASLNGTFTILSKGDDYIVITGMIEATATQNSGEFTVKRTMPEMDYIVESNNRLWGCKYGVITDVYGNNKVVNEIYASKLGDFKNWNAFPGTAADSYAVGVGSDGKFTGAATHLGYPIFFKENCIHKIYGNYPSNYQVQTTTCRGVQDGCHKSIATVNEILYYKARSSVCAYDGSLPIEVSSALGDEQYNEAVAGSLGNKYYISMKDKSNTPHLFVLDTKRNVWHKEDNVHITDFANCRGDLYFINNDTNQIMTVGGTSGTVEPSQIDWEVVTGTMGTDSPDKKYISRIDVRMLLEIGSRVSFYAEYDSSGEWKHLFNMDGVSLKSFSVPVRPERCDHMRLKIVGKGNAKIYSISKQVEWGSDE